MPNFGAALPIEPYGSKENQHFNTASSMQPTVPGVLFPGKIAASETSHSKFQVGMGGSSFSSRSGFSSSFREQVEEAASPHPIRSGDMPRNPLLAKTPTLGNGNVTPRKVSFGSVLTQNNSSKLQGSIATDTSANISFAPEASPLGLSRSNYSLLARAHADAQNSTLTPMSVENGPSESLVTGAHSPAVTFFGVEEDFLSHSTSFVAQTPGKSLLDNSVVSHLQNQDPSVILSAQLRGLAYWQDPLLSAAVFSACASVLASSQLLGLSGVSVLCGGAIAITLLGCFLHWLNRALGFSHPALQRLLALPCFQVDSWETAFLAALACAFRGAEASFAQLRRALSGQDIPSAALGLLALWAGASFGAALEANAGALLGAALLLFFAAPLAWDALAPRVELVRELFGDLKAPVQTLLLALWACAVSALLFLAARALLLALGAADVALLLLAALVVLLLAARAEGQSPGRVLVAALSSGARGMGPGALKVLRAIQSPFKDGQRKR